MRARGMSMSHCSTKTKAQPSKARLVIQRQGLCESCLQFRSVDLVPRRRSLQSFIHVLDVFNTLSLHPLDESLLSLLCKYGNARGPGCASAEHAVELHA